MSQMSNYYYRDKDGDWFISDGEKNYPIEYSGSMEIAYQQGVIDACKQMLKTPIMKSHHLSLAEWWATECERHLDNLKEHNDKLKERLDSQCRPSEALR